MIALSTTEVTKIYQALGAVDDETLNESKKYTLNCFSVFDHWLTENETEGEIFFYEHALRIPNTAEAIRYFKHHDMMYKLYLSLYDKTSVYGLFAPNYGPSAIVSFNNIEEYKSHVLLSIREQLFLKIVLPEYYSVIMGSYDLTHLLYTLKSRPEGREKIETIIKKHGLFISQ